LNDIPKTDPELIKAVAKEAGQLLENRAFTAAVRTLHKQWLGELLLMDRTDVPKVLDLVAKLQVLEAIPKRLDSMSHDAEFLKGAHSGRRGG
jgi:hypothetical protein